MPLNDRKIISIILEQCKRLDERCTGYREELIDLISEIFQLERSHRVKATTIQKQINEKFNASARFLVQTRRHGTGTEGLES